MDKHSVFANSMVNLCQQDTGIGFGASMDVFPLFQHLFRLGRFSEQPTLFFRDPFASDTDLLTNLGRFGEERCQRFLGLCHCLSPTGSNFAVAGSSSLFSLGLFSLFRPSSQADRPVIELEVDME